MNLWVVTYSDGCEFSDVFVEIWDTEEKADERALALNVKHKCGTYDGYSVLEAELNVECK